MSLNFYQFIDEIANKKCNIWIRGDSDTGKTTFLKYLFDCDVSHNYKWMLGGCHPSRSETYYHQIVRDILKTTYNSNAKMAIYVDEIPNCHVKKLMELKDKLRLPIRFIIASHHLPPVDLKDLFAFFQMAEILPIKLLREYISKSCNFTIPIEEKLNISDCFIIIDHIKEINSLNDLMKLYDENAVASQKRKNNKKTVKHSICILQTCEYERINIFIIKEDGHGDYIID